MCRTTYVTRLALLGIIMAQITSVHHVSLDALFVQMAQAAQHVIHQVDINCIPIILRPSVS